MSTMIKSLHDRFEARQQALMMVVGAWVSVLLVAGVLLTSVIAQIGERRAALRELRVKLADAHTMLAQLPQQQAALAKVQERYHALEARIGAGGSVARVLESLHQQAKSHRLELKAVQPRTEESGLRAIPLGSELVLREVPLNLELVGRYRQLGEFLSELDTAPYLAVVRKLTLIKPQPDRPTLKADLVLAVYLADRTPGP